MAINSTTFQNFNTLFSLQPLTSVLEKMIAEEKPGARKLYQGLLNEIKAKPELLQPIKDLAPLEKENELVETLLLTIFPPSSSSNQGIYAVGFPFSHQMVYASPLFEKLFLKNGSKIIGFSNAETEEDLINAAYKLAYDLILKKFYAQPASTVANTIHTVTDIQSGLTKYYELKLDAQFIDVKPASDDFKLPETFSPSEALESDELKELFPISNFRFEGLMVVEVNNVTEEQVIGEIKNVLININSFSDVSIYEDLQQHVQSLIGLKHVKIGITPFFKMNGYYLYTDSLYKNSILFHNREVIQSRDQLNEIIQEIFRDVTQPVLYVALTKNLQYYHELLQYYANEGFKNLVLCPLRSEYGELIGLLEIASREEGYLQFQHITSLQLAIPLFALALQKSQENLELQIDKMIKEHFTAIQPAVEWKFTEAAFQYIQNKQVSELARMPNITFQEVYPLYAAIDVRNSSTERNRSIQLDLIEQLGMVKNIILKACKIIDFPLLEESLFRIDKYMDAVSETLLPDDEIMIYNFLENDIEALFKNLKSTKRELKKLIDGYFSELDAQRKVLYRHRKDYEDSLTRINDVLDRFIDSEQQDAQLAYPHYFERYVTDGIEFNIYIGQSMSPHRPFNEIFVRNLKLWQLTLLAKAARLTSSLEKRLPLPLQTTQLILAHSIPISISFRRKERKFDVDGAYNIRYEIVKKRIDKVHLKDSEERLTQPGKIGIVYSQHKELTEYMEFIEFLQAEKLLTENIEHLDLEDTQGISGLKAVRVEVNLESPNTPPIPKGESSTQAYIQRS